MTLACEETEGLLLCSDGTEWAEHEHVLVPGSAVFFLYIVLCIALVLMAGLMSGLTLGLLSLDSNSLQVIVSGGEEKERAYAKKILPLVRRHHLLLVTLLLGNALCMEALPLFLDRLTSPVAAVAISVTAVLFFGEVIPQAICSRYGLAIGANVRWLVWFIIGIFFVFAYPISKLLDWILGTDHGTYYKRKELTELVKIHASDATENEERLTNDEVLVIQGALEMTHKTVKDAMTVVERVFMIDADQLLDTQLFNIIRNHGHSRVPVYRGNIHNLVGLLIVKELLGYDVTKPMFVRDLTLSEIIVVEPDHPLYDMLRTFESGKSHMAAVQHGNGPSGPEILGVITLEDVIEELINKEISDENDLARKSRKRRASGQAGTLIRRAATRESINMMDALTINTAVAPVSPGLRAANANGSAIRTPVSPAAQKSADVHTAAAEVLQAARRTSVRTAGRGVPFTTIPASPAMRAVSFMQQGSFAEGHAGNHHHHHPKGDDDDDDENGEGDIESLLHQADNRPLIINVHK